MTLLYRIKRLVKANAHGFVDGLEEHQWIVNQAIRDMESELEKQTTFLSEQKQVRIALEQRVQNDDNELSQIEKDIDLALAEKRDDIAKHFIKKSLVGKKRAHTLSAELTSLKAEIGTLEKDLAQKQQAFDDICCQCESAKLSTNQDDVFDAAKVLVEKDLSLEHEVELEFLRRIKKDSK
ncbi:MAG: hypothetical protein ACD_62C00213G0002 [uncultured bacterium]|nr:MAG: hypothetical protein ACD_62C00213G0002 [uncultured bacterium]HLD44705.1 PspA/IM30 family protein [bacterium]